MCDHPQTQPKAEKIQKEIEMKKLYAILTLLVALSIALTACGPKPAQPAPMPVPVASTHDDWCTGADQMKVLVQHQDADQATPGHQDRLVLTAWWSVKMDHNLKVEFKWISGKSAVLLHAAETTFNFTEPALDAKVKLGDQEMVPEMKIRPTGVGGDAYICYNPVP